MQRRMEIEESLDGKQKKINNFTSRDVEGRRVIRLLRATELICKVDVTEIAKDIDEATKDQRRRYLECEDLMRGGESPALLEFLTLQGRGATKRMRVRGVDTKGQPLTHVYKLHEKKIDRHVYVSTYRECEKLCTKFAQECANRLKELASLAPIMEAHHEDEVLFQGLKKLWVWLSGSAPIFDAGEKKRRGKELAEDQERERVVRGLEWDREESDEDYDEEAYDENQAQEDDPFRDEDEGEDVEEIAMDLMVAR
ncbi:unnamed protein product [Closterium sp. NIES-64]|nr:unnamed protein product [Closterium sp. NIES-64]